jgi:hypothetical protein
MEDAMLKYSPICAALVLLATGSVNAQQREAVLQTIDVPNAGFNIVLALPKAGGTTADYRRQPDPNLIYLADAEHVYGQTGNLKELMDSGIVKVHACTFHVDRRDGHAATPVAVYVIPKGDVPLASTTQ